MTASPPPFSLTYTPELPELIAALGVTLALTTHQAGKLIFVSSPDGQRLVQLPRTFPGAIALGCEPGRLAVASRSEVVVLADTSSLAQGYPKQPGTYDAFFAPRVTYHTGPLDLHGLAWGTDGLWAVVTLFSCLGLVGEGESFSARWQPRFVSALEPEDRCHLSGMAMQDGAPRYVTSLGRGDAPKAWRAALPRGGLLMDVPSGEIALGDLAMPHSPRIIDGELYALLSASGEVIRIEPEAARYEVVRQLDGFARGLVEHGGYLFVGMSRLREGSSVFRQLPMTHRAKRSGVTVVHLASGTLVGQLEYESSVDEIFDLALLPCTRRPGVLGIADDTHRGAIVAGGRSFWELER